MMITDEDIPSARNVVGNRFFLRVSEELKALSVNLKQRSSRFSRVPYKKELLHTSNLSDMSSVVASDYHRSAEGRRMQTSTNPQYNPPTPSARKGALVQGILNEVQAGVDDSMRMDLAPGLGSEADGKGARIMRRQCFFRTFVVFIIICVVALIAGIVSTAPAKSSAGVINGSVLNGSNDDPTTTPTSSPTRGPTLTPTLQPTTKAPTKAPTNPCILFCG